MHRDGSLTELSESRREKENFFHLQLKPQNFLMLYTDFVKNIFSVIIITKKKHGMEELSLTENMF